LNKTGSEPPQEGLLVVGRILRPHGIRGVVVVEVISDWPERFSEGNRLLLEKRPSSYEEVTIEAAAPYRDRLLLSLSGIDSREAAETLGGCHLVIPAGAADRLEDGEYWVHELVGMNAWTESGEDLGVVTDLFSGPAQDLLTIMSPGGGEFQVPFVPEFVIAVDREARAITIRAIEGMVP